MDLRPAFTSFDNPNDILELKRIIQEMSDELDIIYTTSNPNGVVSARQGRRAIYKNGSSYETYTNVDGLTTWVRVGGSLNALWVVDGTETQLSTADEIDMQSKKIINVTDPTAAQDAATKASSELYANGKISKTTAGEISAMTEKTTLVDADLFLIEDSAAGNAKKKVQKSNVSQKVLSNVIFLDDLTMGDATYELISNTSLTASPGTNVYRYYIRSVSTSYSEVRPKIRWVKIAGVSTITVVAYVWQFTADSQTQGFQVDVGGQTGENSSISNTQTPTRVSFTIDVSGLVNGTEYDIKFNGKRQSTTSNVYTGLVALFGI